MSAPGHGNERLALVVRDARVDDAEALLALANDVATTRDDPEATHLMRSRLSIEPGDDYFTLVAADSISGEVLGWCAAGGCRGQELKGWGELYSSEEVPGAHGVFAALVDVVVERLTQAQFGAVVLWVPAGDEALLARATRAGFVADSRRQPTTAGAADEVLLVRKLIP